MEACRLAELGGELLGRAQASRHGRVAVPGRIGDRSLDLEEKIVALVGGEVGQRVADGADVAADIVRSGRRAVHAVTSSSVLSKVESVREKSAQTARASSSWLRPRSVMP